MTRAPFAPRPPRRPSLRQSRGQAYAQRQSAADIWIPWHVLSRFRRFHVTIAKSDDSGQRWHTCLVRAALRWSGRNKRSYRPTWLKTHIFPVSFHTRPAR